MFEYFTILSVNLGVVRTRDGRMVRWARRYVSELHETYNFTLKPIVTSAYCHQTNKFLHLPYLESLRETRNRKHARWAYSVNYSFGVSREYIEQKTGSASDYTISHYIGAM